MKGERIQGSNVAFCYALRTVTRPGGVAVRLSAGEMALFKSLLDARPEPVRVGCYVLVHRLRSKLAPLSISVDTTDNGYRLAL